MSHDVLLRILDVADYVEAGMAVTCFVFAIFGFARMATEGSGGIPDAE